MAKKVSKNARVGQRAANAGSGRDFVKVVKSIKDPASGKYTYKEEEGGRKNSRSLMTTDEIRTIPINQSIIVCGHHRPILAKMIPYYKNRRMLALTIYACPEPEGGANTENVSFIPLK